MRRGIPYLILFASLFLVYKTIGKPALTSAHPSTINRIYTYDNVYRLTGETINGTPSTGSASYGYDPVGNRLSRLSTLNSILSTSASFDANDRLNTDSYDANDNTVVGAGFGQSRSQPFSTTRKSRPVE